MAFDAIQRNNYSTSNSWIISFASKLKEKIKEELPPAKTVGPILCFLMVISLNKFIDTERTDNTTKAQIQVMSKKNLECKTSSILPT